MDSNKIEILGRSYTIAGMGDSVYLQELAQFVDARMRQVVESTGTVDTLKVAILAALNITDSYFKARSEAPRANEEMERSIAALNEQIETALAS